jgi:serine/threonine-protein kinase PRP4
MFLSLHELRKHKIIHADIKPDNFLMDLSLKNIKLADFGTSFSLEEHSTDIEYLVARYYRAPEIILGCETPPEQRYGIDTWAVGCSLFEIFTGKFLFDGNSNNEMLKLMQETKGKFSIKMLKKCKFFEKHFDSEFNFLYTYYDKNTKETVVSKMQVGIAP